MFLQYRNVDVIIFVQYAYIDVGIKLLHACVVLDQSSKCFIHTLLYPDSPSMS